VARETRPGSEDDHHGALFEERLRAWLKAELGIGDPVSPDLELVREALENGSLVPTWRLWHVRSDDPEGPVAAAEIDLMLTFLEDEYGAPTVAKLVHSLRDADHLAEVLGGVGGERWSAVEDRLLTYLREQTVASKDSLAAFASYDLLVACDQFAEMSHIRDLWGWRFDRTEATLLATRSAEEGFTPIYWAPGGTQLLIQREPGYGDGLSVLHAGSTEAQALQLPTGARPINQYRLGASGWSADGSHLAYLLYRGGPGSPAPESRIMNAGTGEEFALEGDFVAWSPQDSWLLYSRDSRVGTPWSDSASGSATRRGFFVAQEDGTGARWIGDGQVAAWSPLGDQIATISSEPALVIYNVASGLRTTRLGADSLQEALGFALTFSQPYRRTPVTLAWSPDGTSVTVGAYHGGDDGREEGAILLVGANQHHVLRRTAGAIYDLAWASQGRWLRALVVGEEWFASIVIGRDGSLAMEEERALAAWSPDGQHLAVTRFTGEGRNVEIVEAETGRRRHIGVPGECQPPVWNPRAPLASDALQ
jgi:hypothetical protein